MDLWDLKPGEQTGGEFKPIKTTASGVEICEVLPTVAEQFKHLSLVRSLVTNEGSHERGTVLMNTGRQPNPVVQYPAIGAVASSLLTSKDLRSARFHRRRRHRPAHRRRLPRHDVRSRSRSRTPASRRKTSPPPPASAKPKRWKNASAAVNACSTPSKTTSPVRAPSRPSRIPPTAKRPAAPPRRTKPSTRRAST